LRRPDSRTLGVVGTLVWDRIVPAGPTQTTEEWGGIAYSLATLDALLGEEWTVLPLLKIGSDVEVAAQEFLNTLESVDSGAVVTVPEANNRVELRYVDEHERIETLSGGVPGWGYDELVPATADCDALYVNFISGSELTQSAAVEFGRKFAGPVYADLHSLFLGIDEHGRRFGRCPRNPQAWVESFDFVQMNRAEAKLAVDGGAALDVPGAAGLAITGGPEGVVYEADPALIRSPPEWPTAPSLRSARGHVPADPGARVVDPTGCGDVWGAACFAGLLVGRGLQSAAEQATRLAETALGLRGTTGLTTALASRRAIGEGAS